MIFAEPPEPWQAQLESLITQNLDRVFPAASIAVLHQGEVKLHQAWGWVDPETRHIPCTTDTLFDLASVTKLFTVTAFLSLVSAGRVQLDDPLVAVIPEFGILTPRPIDGGQNPHTKEKLPTPKIHVGKTVDPAQVTFRHVLTHSSGLAPWRDVYNAVGTAPEPPTQPLNIPREVRWQRALEKIVTYPFVDAVGAAIHYSDLGLMLLGEAVARLHNRQSGQLDIAVQERVTIPLDLNVCFKPTQHGYQREDIAPTEDDPQWRGRRCWGEVHDENACGLGGVAGHAGLFGTSLDIATFGQAWLSQDPRLSINKTLMQAATREQFVTDGERRGLGWMLRSDVGSSAGNVMSHDTYGHTGFTGTSLFIDPRRALVVVILTNRVYPGRDVPGILAFRQAAHNIVASAFE